MGVAVSDDNTNDNSVERVIGRYRGENPVFIYGSFGGVGSHPSSDEMGHYQAIVPVK